MLRNPKSIPAGDCLIEDPIIEPFFISKSQSGGYVVYKRVIKGKEQKPYIETIGYPSNFTHALTIVSKELLHTEPGKNYTSISEYVNTWKAIAEKITKLTEI